MASSLRAVKLARAFTELAETAAEGGRAVELLRVLPRHCETVLDVRAAAVAVGDDRAGQPEAWASDQHVRALEAEMAASRQGPAMDSFRSLARIPDTALGSPESRERWPVFDERATRLGLRGVMALPLVRDGRRVGALTLYRTDTAPLDGHRCEIAQALADVTMINLLQGETLDEKRRLAGQLQFALDSRVVIEQAKGIIAERRRVPLDQAFQTLRSDARSRRIKLMDLARGIVDGEEPDFPAGPADEAG